MARVEFFPQALALLEAVAWQNHNSLPSASPLSARSLAPAPALLETRSLTVLTPLYGEDVMYSLDGLESALLLGLGGKDPASVGSVLPNLLPESTAASTSGVVSLLTYLRDLYPNDWEHFKERVARLAKANAHKVDSLALAECLKHGYGDISEWHFAAGNALAPWAAELQLWASYRSQVPYRGNWSLILTRACFSFHTASTAMPAAY